ncbi:GDSL-type esterase/lipase family protein [Streptomyces tanashiensis]
MHWLDPAPFLRGTAWLDGDRPVRADPDDLERLPWDIAERAALPIRVRIEFTATPGTRAVELRYRAAVPEPGDPLRALRHCFALWQGTRLVGETCAAPAPEAVVTLPLPPRGGVFTVHLPEGRAPVPLALRALGGALSRPGQAPLARPRRLDHRGLVGDPPAHSWPATAGRLSASTRSTWGTRAGPGANCPSPNTWPGSRAR